MQNICLGEGRNPSPSFASVRASASRRIPQSGTGLTPPGSHNPLSRFHIHVRSVASDLTGKDFENGGARQIPDALAEMPEAASCVFDPPSQFAHTFCSLRFLNTKLLFQFYHFALFYFLSPVFLGIVLLLRQIHAKTFLLHRWLYLFASRTKS